MSLTPEQRSALLARRAQLLAQMQGGNFTGGSAQAPISPKPTRNEETARAIGRTGRMLATGAASVADLPRTLIGNPLYYAGYQLSDLIGSESGKQQFAGLLNAPTFAEQTRQGIDTMTGGALAPRNALERVVDVAGETLAAGAGPGLAARGATGIPQQVARFLSPQTGGEAVAALGAGAGGQAASEMGGGPLAQFAGQLAGGALGAKVGGTTPKVQKIKPKTAEELRALANQAYQNADEAGGILTSQFTNKLLGRIEEIRPQTAAGRMLSGDDAFSKIADRFQGLRDRKLTLQEAQEIDEFLGDAIDGFTEMGRVTKQGKKLLDIQSSLRNMIEDAAPDMIEGGKEGFKQLKEARKLWSAQARMRDIEKIITRADMTDNPATSLKSGFGTLAKNENKMRGYSEAEKKLIRRAAETDIGTDVLRTLGSRLMPIITTATGAGLTGSAAAAAGSTASRSLASRSQLKRAEDVIKEISNRATGNIEPMTPSSLPKITQPSAQAQALSQPVEPPAPELIQQQPQPQMSEPTQQPLTPEMRQQLERRREELLRMMQQQQPSTLPESPSLAPLPQAPAERNDEQSMIKQSISMAAQEVGVPEPVLLAFAQIESGMNPNAKASTSSATGLLQFTRPTWASMVRKYGEQTGIGMSDIADPQANARMGALLVRDNALSLQNRLGRLPKPSEVYMAHFLGEGKAARLIKMADSETPAVRAFPKEAQANKAIFYDGTRPRSMSEVYNLLDEKINSGIQQFLS